MAKTVSFGGTDWDADQQAIDQRRKLAIALMQQSAMAQPTETAGGIAVRQSPLSGLARMLTGVVGKQDLNAADADQRDLQSRKSAMLADWLERMPKATTEQQLMGDRPGAGSFENVTKQPGLNDYMQWASQGALMGPQAGQIGQTGLNLAMGQQQRADQREFQSAQAEETRKHRQMELLMKLEDARVGREEKIAAQQELMRMQLEGRMQMGELAASLRQPPAPVSLTIADPADPTKGIVIDARTRQKIGDAPPAKTPATKPVPASVNTAIVENKNAVRKLDQALKELETRPEGVGLSKGLQPDWLSQRTDPEGVKLRALIADIGSLKIHDRSGAAVTAAEFPRLKPFIPNVGDKPETVKTKLENFRNEYQSVLDDMASIYSEDQGYRTAPAGATGSWDDAPPAGAVRRVK